MRILFIAARFHTNQISLINKLKEEGHTLDFFVIGKGNSEDYNSITPKAIPISFLTSKYIQYFKKDVDFAVFQKIAIPSPIKYYKMINNFKPDVIIIRGGPEPVYSWFLFPYIFSSIRLVYYTQSPKMITKISLLRRIYDYVLSNRYKIRWFTPVWYQSNKNGKFRDLHYIEYLPFFIYPKTVEIKETLSCDKIHFLCVAKYEPRKNLSMLLDVVMELFKMHKNFKLTIIGSTGTDKREKYYESMKLKLEVNKIKDVTLLKNIPFAEMEKYYRSHQVFLMPTSKEPASISQLEAMSYGLAVICSRDNGTAHYVQNKVNGYLIEPSAIELKQAMEMYLLQPEIIKNHQEESLNLVNTDFSVDRSYKKLMNLLQ
jgi:glycosyltransferase involved in cell wall biosynthesis